VSSSGLIYAGIVGAWAVYLVPVWLRREEQLNEARKKARYAAAIRTLGRTEQFERRWLADETLSATGTDGALRPPTESTNTKPGTAKPGKPSSTPAKKAVPPGRRPQTTGTKPTPGATTTASSQDRRPQTVSRRPAPVAAAERHRPKGVSARLPHPSQRAATGPTVGSQLRHQAQAVRHRGVLLMRRRRVVAFLFTLATAGAFVSAALGITYIWAMLAPATLFSVYIINIRRDERLRAEERYRRRQAALAAERRRERQRLQAEPQAPEQAAPAPRQTHPEPFRRAANG
jgi:hypothetical protein